MKRAFAWLTRPNNREAVLAMVTVTSAVLGGGWFLYDRLTKGDASPPPPGMMITAGGDVGQVQHVGAGATAVQAAAGAVVTIGYTIEQHEERLARREAELRADLAGTHATDRAALLAQIDEVRRQAADAQTSFEARKAELAWAMARLDDIAEGLPQSRLDAARRALAAGDDSQADAIFAEVEVMEAAAVSRAAEAAYERGRIADADIRWTEAADHYARAARLAPTYDRLRKACASAWDAGDYSAALRFGEDLRKVAFTEFGEDSAEYVVALNDHAIALHELGQYSRAEPLYRQALAIDEKTLGTEHPDYAVHFNNLASLLRATGRPAEAEPLYRQALAILVAIYGEDHLTTRIVAANLAALGRDEAGGGVGTPP